MEGIGDYEAALELLRQTDRVAAECNVLSRLAWAYWASGQSTRGLALAREAEAKANALGDRALALRASAVVSFALQNEGHLQESHAQVRRTLMASRKGGDQTLTALCLYVLAMQNNFVGRFGRAAACARLACDLNHRLVERASECGGLFYLALAEGGRGNYDAAWTALEEGYALAQQIRSPVWLARYPNQRAWLSAELGDWETAYEIDRAGLEPARAVPGLREFEISTLINLALDCIALHRLDEADAYLVESQRDVGRPEFGSHNWRWQTRLADARARLALAQGKYAVASEALGALFQWAELTHARKYLARGLVLRAELHLQHDDVPAAEHDLSAAVAHADQMCYFPTRIDARTQLGSSLRTDRIRGTGRSNAPRTE